MLLPLRGTKYINPTLNNLGKISLKILLRRVIMKKRLRNTALDTSAMHAILLPLMLP